MLEKLRKTEKIEASDIIMKLMPQMLTIIIKIESITISL